MTFDIIEVTDEQLSKLPAVQMQMLRSAQKKKNELLHGLEEDLKVYKNVYLANGMEYSSLYSAKQAELTEECERQIEILREQLEYSLTVSEPLPPEGEGGDNEAEYIVDYTLPYTDRYRIVRDYYLAMPDPAERMDLYSKDEVAKKYLGTYYSTLYNVLYSYSI